MDKKEKELKLFKILSLILLIVIVVGIFTTITFLIFAPRIYGNSSSSPKNVLADVSKAPVIQTTIGKSFNFLIEKNSTDNFKLTVGKAQIVKVVSSKDKLIMAKAGEAYLLLNLEIENSKTVPISVNNTNYFRLLVDKNKKLAPDFFNGPIVIQGISTRKDQVGFIVLDNTKKFSLEVGELDGKKEVINFNF